MSNDVYTSNKQTNTNCIFSVKDFAEIKSKVLNWIKQFDTFCFLDNHQYASDHNGQEVLVAAGSRESVSGNTAGILHDFQQKLSSGKDWWFGHLSYELHKNDKAAPHQNRDTFPRLHFFKPEVLIRLDKEKISISAEGNETDIHRQIIERDNFVPVTPSAKINIRQRLTKSEYISIVEKLRSHILRGDCYEINFCQEFFAEHAEIDPLSMYHLLSQASPNPFSAFYRAGDNFLICASPERFLQKTGTKIFAQPIKGTSIRFPGDPGRDSLSREWLQSSKKDQSENVMVVDLVRNDLSVICREGTVQVDELFGVYPFPQVYQMISTVSGQLKDDVSFREIIHATFPMGSMTGAPKKRVMELIEKYEVSERGIFSGSLGYINPGGDFDFNVIIRSLIYNQSTQYISFPAGSGITFYSEPEKEYEECLVKAAAIQKILGG